MITVVTARALQLAGTHPSVAAVRVIEDAADGAVTAEIDVRTQLPAAWRMAGVSPFGARGIEVVTFAFPAVYPMRPPFITLRHDFNRGHPHINPGPSNEPPVPCIVDGSLGELLQRRGIEGVLDQLADWLDRASTFTLNDPTRGWEPVRRDGIDDVMVVDGAGLRSFAEGDGGGSVLLRTGFVYREDGEKRLYLVDQRSCVPIDPRVASFGRVACGLDLWRGNGAGIVVWAPREVAGVPFVVDEYMPETVSTVGDLIERSKRYGCLSHLDGLFSQLAVGLHGKTFEPTPLTVTFLVRRPRDVIGTASAIELCPYLIHVRSGEDLIKVDRPVVRHCAALEQISLPILRRASGENEAPGRAPWTLVGCGSVGSKIGVHMARRGHGPSVLVDRGVMSPHNYARHAVFPHADSIRASESKASMLAEVLGRLQQTPSDKIEEDAVALCGTVEGRAKLAPRDAGLLNTTASAVLREALAFAPWEERPAMGEAHLLGAGRVAYASFEGRSGNPSISDLAVASYRLIAEDVELARTVFSAEAEAVAIGQGCSAITFPMPDSRLSALTAGLGEVVAMRHFPQPSNEGEIRLGRLGADGLSQSWTKETVPPWTIVRDGADGGVGVRMSARVDEAIRAEIAARPCGETGGVIVGRFSQIGNTFHIVDLLPAPPDSTFSPERFVLGTIGLKAAIRKVLKDSGNSLYVLGTWHNHLIKVGPSGLDAATAAGLAMRQFFPVLMLIALPEGYTALVAEAFGAGAPAAALAEERISADGV
ncbi:thiamine biosynthesis protein ThiF [Beijerinckia sp. L45]|uniref:thiamine biosynthesis protein ThiF n=1 Tax=Beijerinckia sp. L45 TaxID=1641855 RepID=UPI00131AF011|nr:thiamine biosynthesis protein ThiF [Beijerinckia sp. L45]